MGRITTAAGQEHSSAEEALSAIRRNIAVQLDPASDLVTTARATTEMIYTFQALDSYLKEGGQMPADWS